MRFALAMLLAVSAIAQTTTTDADRQFAAKLAALPEEQAHAALAAADSTQITVGLAKALNEAAIRVYNQHDTWGSIRIYRLETQAAVRGGFVLNEGDGRANSGISLTRAGELEQALQEINRGLELYRQANAPPAKIANALNSRSVVYKELGELDAAQIDSRAALEMFEKLGDEVPVARALNGSALLLMRMGDYRHALETLQRSLAIAQRHDETLGQAFVLNNIGELYSMQGNFALAASFTERSLKLKEALGSKEDLATSLINLGVIYHQDKRDAAAMESLTRAAAIGRETGRKVVTAEALSELGAVEFDRGHYPASLEYQNEALQLYQTAGSSVLESRALGRIAQVNAAQLDYSGAAGFADRARDLARAHGAMPELFLPDLIAGRAYRELGRSTEARAALEDAVAVVESERDRVAGDQSSRQKFLSSRIAPYREMISLELREGYPEAALKMTERAKARVLLDLLSGGKARGTEILTALERGREAELRRKLVSARAQLAGLAGSDHADPDRVRQASARVESARVDLEEFRSVLYSTHPELGARRGDVAPISVAQAAQLLPDSDSAILDYAATPGGTWLFVIVKGAGGAVLRVHKISLSEEELRRDAADFRDKLATRDPGFSQAAARLYKALLGPARQELTGKKLLIIAPDADLWQVPFQALRSPAGRYLIEDAAVFYTPSLAVLHSLHLAGNAAGGRPTTLAAFGNPAGDNPDEQREMEALAQLYGAAANIRTGREASREAFRARAGNYDVIHVAAHGVFDDRDPLRSHILLHRPAGNSAEDGWMEAGEIQDLELKARLVVLSGCETARGGFAEGEGSIGMSWAFLAAGSRAVAASQWRVESSATTRLMIEFHQGLLRGTGEAQALRQASLSLMRTERFRHPFYWAGFALFGDGY